MGGGNEPHTNKFILKIQFAPATLESMDYSFSDAKELLKKTLNLSLLKGQ